MKQIRLSKTNDEAIIQLVKDANNVLLTVPKAVNIAVEKGLPAVRKQFVKISKS